MNGVYAAFSLHGPVAKVAFKMHRSVNDSTTSEQKQPEKKQKIEPEPPAVESNSNQHMFAQMQQFMMQQQQQQQLQQQQQHEQQMAAMQKLNNKPSVNVPVKPDLSQKQSNVPYYGRALNTERLRHMHSIKRYFMSHEHAVCTHDQGPATDVVKRVFKKLCKQRLAKSLEAGTEWFAFDVTYFTDENEGPFVNLIRNYWCKR
jgi:hypothetical protein